MRRIYLLAASFLIVARGLAQDTSSISRSMEAIDSVSALIEKDPSLIQSPFMGGSTARFARDGGSIKGTIYRNPKSKTVDKLLLVVDSTGEKTICYCIRNSISKILVDNSAYYYMHEQYYNADGRVEISPARRTQFIRDEQLLKAAIAIGN